MPKLLTCCLLALPVLAAEPVTNRPSAWARPIEMEGVPNLFQVSTNLYRPPRPANTPPVREFSGLTPLNVLPVW